MVRIPELERWTDTVNAQGASPGGGVSPRAGWAGISTPRTSSRSPAAHRARGRPTKSRSAAGSASAGAEGTGGLVSPRSPRPLTNLASRERWGGMPLSPKGSGTSVVLSPTTSQSNAVGGGLPVPAAAVKAGAAGANGVSHQPSLENGDLNPEVEYLYLRENDFTHFDAGQPLYVLKTLDLSINGLTSCDFLWDVNPPPLLDPQASCCRFPALKHLYLTSNSLTSMDGLRGMRSLETLTLSSNSITSFDGLWGLPNLRVLSLHHNGIRDLKGFPYLPSLNSINLVGNPVAQHPFYRMLVLAASNPSRIDNRDVSSDERFASRTWRGRTAFAVTEGFVPTAAACESYAFAAALASEVDTFILRSQSAPGPLSSAEPLQLLSIRVSQASNDDAPQDDANGLNLASSCASLPQNFDAGGYESDAFSSTVGALANTQALAGSPRVPVRSLSATANGASVGVGSGTTGGVIEGEPLLLHICLQERRRRSAYKDEVFFNPHILPIEFKVTGDAQRVRLRTTLDHRPGTAGVEMTKSVEDDEAAFRSTLYSTPGGCLFKYVVDGRSVADEPTVTGADGTLYTHLNIPESPDDQSELLDGRKTILHIRWLVANDQQGWDIVPDANGPVFYPMSQHLGRCLRAEVLVYHKQAFARLFYVITEPVTPGPPSVVSLQLRGEAVEGERVSLTAWYNGGVEEGSIVAWYRRAADGSYTRRIPMPDSSSTHYVLQSDDVGHTILVTYTPRRNDGVVGRSAEAALHGGPVLPLPPVLSHLQFDSAVATEGAPLTLSGVFFGGSGGEGRHRFRWKNASGKAYDKFDDCSTVVPSRADVGGQLQVSVTPCDAQGRLGRAVALLTPTVTAGSPAAEDVTLAGLCEEGKTLTVKYTYVGGKEGTPSVRWHTPTGSRVSGDVTYKLKKSDVGCIVTCTLTPVRADGVQGAPVTVLSPVIVAAKPSATLFVTGAPFEGELLRASLVYVGGHEGDSTVAWGRCRGDEPVVWDDEGGSFERRLTASDVGCTVAVRYTPVREDGVVGNSVVARSLVVGERRTSSPLSSPRGGAAGGGSSASAGPPLRLRSRSMSPTSPREHQSPRDSTVSQLASSGTLGSPPSSPRGRRRSFNFNKASSRIKWPDTLCEFDTLEGSQVLGIDLTLEKHAAATVEWHTSSSGGRKRLVGQSETYLLKRADVGKRLHVSFTPPGADQPATSQSPCVVLQSLKRIGVCVGRAGDSTSASTTWRATDDEAPASPRGLPELTVDTRCEVMYEMHKSETKADIFWEASTSGGKWQTVDKGETFTPSLRETACRLRVVVVPVIEGSNGLFERGTRVLTDVGHITGSGRPERGRAMSSATAPKNSSFVSRSSSAGAGKSSDMLNASGSFNKPTATGRKPALPREARRSLVKKKDAVRVATSVKSASSRPRAGSAVSVASKQDNETDLSPCTPLTPLDACRVESMPCSDATSSPAQPSFTEFTLALPDITVDATAEDDPDVATWTISDRDHLDSNPSIGATVEPSTDPEVALQVPVPEGGFRIEVTPMTPESGSLAVTEVKVEVPPPVLVQPPPVVDITPPSPPPVVNITPPSPPPAKDLPAPAAPEPVVAVTPPSPPPAELKAASPVDIVVKVTPPTPATAPVQPPPTVPTPPVLDVTPPSPAVTPFAIEVTESEEVKVADPALAATSSSATTTATTTRTDDECPSFLGQDVTVSDRSASPPASDDAAPSPTARTVKIQTPRQSPRLPPKLILPVSEEVSPPVAKAPVKGRRRSLSSVGNASSSSLPRSPRSPLSPVSYGRRDSDTSTLLSIPNTPTVSFSGTTTGGNSKPSAQRRTRSQSMASSLNTPTTATASRQFPAPGGVGFTDSVQTAPLGDNDAVSSCGSYSYDDVAEYARSYGSPSNSLTSTANSPSGSQQQLRSSMKSPSGVNSPTTNDGGGKSLGFAALAPASAEARPKAASGRRLRSATTVRVRPTAPLVVDKPATPPTVRPVRRGPAAPAVPPPSLPAVSPNDDTALPVAAPFDPKNPAATPPTPSLAADAAPEFFPGEEPPKKELLPAATAPPAGGARARRNRSMTMRQEAPAPKKLSVAGGAGGGGGGLSGGGSVRRRGSFMGGAPPAHLAAGSPPAGRPRRGSMLGGAPPATHRSGSSSQHSQVHEAPRGGAGSGVSARGKSSFAQAALAGSEIRFTSLSFPTGPCAQIATTVSLLTNYQGGGAEGRSIFRWQRRYEGSGEDGWEDIMTDDPYSIVGTVADAHCEYRVDATPINWKGHHGERRVSELLKMRWGEEAIEAVLMCLARTPSFDVLVAMKGSLIAAEPAPAVLSLSGRKLKLRSAGQREPFAKAALDSRHLVGCTLQASDADDGPRLELYIDGTDYVVTLPPPMGAPEADFLVLLIRVWLCMSDPVTCETYLGKAVAVQWQEGMLGIEEVGKREDLLRPAFEKPASRVAIPPKPTNRQEENLRTFATFCHDIALEFGRASEGVAVSGLG